MAACSKWGASRCGSLVYGSRSAGLRRASPLISRLVEVRFEAVGDETRVTVEHRGWDTVPQDHVARHHFPDGIFLRRHGEWWQALLGSYGARMKHDGSLAASPPTA